jgi:hypothetical protein
MTQLPEHLPPPKEAIMTVWVIYERPRDFPQGYVLRAQYAMRGGAVKPSADAWYADDADKLRAIVPFGLARMPRMPDDDPKIVETWI